MTALRSLCCRVQPDARLRSASLFLIGYSSAVVIFAGAISALTASV